MFAELDPQQLQDLLYHTADKLHKLSDWQSLLSKPESIFSVEASASVKLDLVRAAVKEYNGNDDRPKPETYQRVKPASSNAGKSSGPPKRERGRRNMRKR